MTVATSLAAQLPALVQEASTLLMPVLFGEGTADLFGQSHNLSIAPDIYRSAATACEFEGLIAGIKIDTTNLPSSLDASWKSLRKAPNDESPAADPMIIGAESFLVGVRTGLIGNLGQLTDEARPYAEIFLNGAMDVYSDADCVDPPPFLRSVSRAWARFLCEGNAPNLDNFELRSKDMGKACAEILREPHKMGIVGGLSSSRLLSSLHVRDVPAFLQAKGWLVGVLEVFCRREDVALEETIRVLENNRASIISYALNRGDLVYVKEAVEAVAPPGRFFRSLSEAIKEIGANDPSTARAFKNRHFMVVSKLIHQGSLNVTKGTLLELKGWRK